MKMNLKSGKPKQDLQSTSFKLRMNSNGSDETPNGIVQHRSWRKV